MAQGKVDRAQKPRTHVEQAQGTTREQIESVVSVLRGNLFAAAALRHETGEFRKKQVR